MALFYGKTEKATPGSLDKTEEQMKNYPYEDENGRFTWMNFIRTGTNDRRQDRPKQFYPIFVSDKNEIRIPKMEWDNNQREWILEEPALDNETSVCPIRKSDNQLVEGNWSRGHERVIANPNEYRVRRTNSNKISIQFKAYMDENAKPKTWWDKRQFISQLMARCN